MSKDSLHIGPETRDYETRDFGLSRVPKSRVPRQMILKFNFE